MPASRAGCTRPLPEGDFSALGVLVATVWRPAPWVRSVRKEGAMYIGGGLIALILIIIILVLIF
jgi:hypothetical protein